MYSIKEVTKYIGVIILVFTTMVLFTRCKIEEADRYKNTQYGFSIIFPEKWEIKEGFMGTVVAAISPDEHGNKVVPENVNITAKKTDDITVDSVISVTRKDFREHLYKYREYNSGTKKLSHKDAVWMIYSYQAGIVRLKVLLYFTKGKDSIFIITCTSLEEEFDKNKPQFEKIVQSFKI